jgi:homospermidine synthase
VSDTIKIPFGGRILVIGCGAVSRGLLVMLARHMDMPMERITIMDMADVRARIPGALAAGMQFVQHQITPDNITETLAAYVSAGDLLIDLAWNIETADKLEWCHEHGVLYVNTSIELWDPYQDAHLTPPAERTLYTRHLALRKQAARWSTRGPTAVVEHGANPGLVSHWTKVALEDITRTIFKTLALDHTRRTALETALDSGDYPRLAMLTGTRVIHISERDTQVSSIPKKVNEFVNTWSIEGFREEGIAPAEMGWGTHERRLPPGAQKHAYGPGNQICLSQMGMHTWVRSWVPKGGQIVGMIIRHGEAFTISDHLTVWQDSVPVYRPTVHYAYLPTDAAANSMHELRMRNYEMQDRQRILTDDIVSGEDEVGVLLLGHDLNGWWTGSQLSIEETRALLGPGHNATIAQVAASVLGAVAWMTRNPERGVHIPDQLPHHEVLKVARPYLGPCPSVQTDWTPLKDRWDPFEYFGKPRPADDDVWQFETFLV